MLLVYKGRAYKSMQEAAMALDMDVNYVKQMHINLQDPKYISSNWALVEDTPEAIKYGILKTTDGWVFDLEIKKATSDNQMATALETIKREAAISATYDRKIAAAKKFIAKCIETLGHPDD